MIPRATYRLQFHKDFTFADAVGHAEYFAKLGVSHIYASPILTARAGSMHGYDVVDHARINPELGGADGFEALAAAFKAQGLGIIVDIVPNHMAVGGADNAWWLDVLRRGQASRYASHFDIDFAPSDPALRGKVLAPFLGAPYGEVLKSGDLKIVTDNPHGEAAIAYHHHRFPIRPEDQAALRADASSFASPDALHALLERQNFRLAWWRTAGDRINWRRFFDIIELAGLRIEDDAVFEAVHAITFDLYARGLIDGVRVDHVDGLADPAAYCRKLRAALTARDGERPPGASPPPAYVIVEKILSPGEALPADWPIDGTTGYDFMNQVSALQHDPRGEGPLSAQWHRIALRSADFEPEELAARPEILAGAFDGQLQALADGIAALASADIATRDITQAALRRAIVQIVRHLRVYRSYATGLDGTPPLDTAVTDAMAAARAEMGSEAAAIDFVAHILQRADTAAIVRAFNQLTAPVTAKAVEDTAFYRYGRLLSRNDVGFDPRCFSLPVDTFHVAMIERARTAPNAMLATATHDHKRGEDLRARLAVLSELPELWVAKAGHWTKLNAALRPALIDPGDDYQLYQTLVGAWPHGLARDDDKGLKTLRDRVWGWYQKALREAKLRTSWNAPNAEFENANHQYADALLDPKTSGTFLTDLAAFANQIAPAGASNGLVQTVLRYTVPGVPDLYQGTEFWDLSLVDPDNRRAVDYTARETALRTAPAPSTLASSWPNGAIKQSLITALLASRSANPALFTIGSYRALRVEGVRRNNLIAFARENDTAQLVVIAALRSADGVMGTDRITPSAAWWGDTAVAGVPSGSLRPIFGPGPPLSGPSIQASKALESLPIAVFEIA